LPNNNPNRFLNVVAALFLIGFSCFLLMELQSILLPLFIAVIISFVFLPFYNFMLRKKFPPALAIVVVILTIIIISNISSVFILTSVNSFTTEFPKYEEKFLKFYDDTIAKLNLSPSEAASLNKSLDLKKIVMSGMFTNFVTSLFSGITALMGNYILILFYIIFLLSETDSIRTRIKAAFTQEKEAVLSHTMTDIFRDVKDYLSGKTLLSFIQAVIIGLLLWICGVDFFFIWAFMFFLSDFIPNIGSMLVTILVGTIMFLQFDGIVKPIIIVVVLIIIQNLKGNILEPRIFGKRLDLSPLLLFFSLIFWGYIWGVVGMILSIPIMSMIKIIFMNVPELKPYAILMSNNVSTVKNKKQKKI